MLALVRTPSRFRRIGTALLPLIAAAALAVSTAAAPTVFFQPEPICGGEPGTQFEASIWVDDSGDSIGCFHLLMTYDRNRLTLVSATEGDLFRFAGPPTFFVWEYPGIDTTAFTDCLLGSQTYVVGPGELVKLRFRVEQCPPDTAGLFQVERRVNPPPLDMAFLADRDRELIPGVQYEDAVAWLCEECVSGVSEGTIRAGGMLALSPNPVTDRLEARWSLPGGTASARFEIFAADGRRVFAREIRETEGAFFWNLRDPAGEAVPSGAYFARLRCGEQTISGKIFKIR